MAEQSTVETWERLIQFHRGAITEMDQHLREKFDHSLDDYDVLHQVSVSDGPIRMGDLADNLLVAKSSCNRIVERLVGGGFLQRTHDELDRRVVLIALTRKGTSLRRRMAALHGRDIEARVGATLTPTQVKNLDEILRRLLAAPAVSAVAC